MGLDVDPDVILSAVCVLVVLYKRKHTQNEGMLGIPTH